MSGSPRSLRARSSSRYVIGGVVGPAEAATDGESQKMPTDPNQRAKAIANFTTSDDHYGSPPEEEARRYSPATCKSLDKRVIAGNPEASKISTSDVERQTFLATPSRHLLFLVLRTVRVAFFADVARRRGCLPTRRSRTWPTVRIRIVVSGSGRWC